MVVKILQFLRKDLDIEHLKSIIRTFLAVCFKTRQPWKELNLPIENKSQIQLCMEKQFGLGSNCQRKKVENRLYHRIGHILLQPSIASIFWKLYLSQTEQQRAPKRSFIILYEKVNQSASKICFLANEIAHKIPL